MKIWLDDIRKASLDFVHTKSVNETKEIILKAEQEGVKMTRKKRVCITVFDAICLFLGRIVFWMLATIIVGCIVLILVKGLYNLCLLLWPFVLSHIGLFIIMLISIYIGYTIWHYIKYDIQVLNIYGHRVVLRKKIFKFLYTTPTCSFYNVMPK